ncbi:hypothetical protein K469DRAFT_164888 [Zopfia rhizophila CBS 207.26]|uniref:Uncharacterized protein n=1 Tax=Zopfia rhizophila CBS 207.26 TaxID=1314779 RepID=A0A6A6E3Q7_9PEZI|nr:hypothetical protein K469DRAFT_164888 [Zopfia rhizophila CBS 207.26]
MAIAESAERLAYFCMHVCAAYISIKSDSGLGVGLRFRRSLALVRSTNASSIETAISFRHSHRTTSRCGPTHDYAYPESFRDIEICSSPHILMLLEPIATNPYTKQQPDVSSQLVEGEYDEIRDIQAKMGGWALDIVGMVADDRDWHDIEYQGRSLRFGKLY